MLASTSNAGSPLVWSALVSSTVEQFRGGASFCTGDAGFDFGDAGNDFSISGLNSWAATLFASEVVKESLLAVGGSA